MSTQVALFATPSQRLPVGQSLLDVVLMSLLDFLLHTAQRVNILLTNSVREMLHSGNGQNGLRCQVSPLDAWSRRRVNTRNQHDSLLLHKGLP